MAHMSQLKRVRTKKPLPKRFFDSLRAAQKGEIKKQDSKNIVISNNEIRKLSAAEIMAKQDNGATLFVRWSRGPHYDKEASRDYLNSGIHIGLSAVQLGNWDEQYMIRRLGEYRFLQMKDAKIAPYIYTGKVVGLDSDGYELIDVKSAKCIGKWNGR